MSKTPTPADLLADPGKATAAAIDAAQASLQADMAARQAEWEAIAKNGNTMGAKRRALVEAGDIDAIVKNDAQAEVLQAKIDLLRDQHRALSDLRKIVFKRESATNLPKQYTALTARLQHIADLGAEVLAEWEQVGSQLEAIEQMRRALDDDAPAPDTALAEALQAAWAGAAPPQPSATPYDHGVRGNVARSLGLVADGLDSGGLLSTRVRVA